MYIPLVDFQSNRTRIIFSTNLTRELLAMNTHHVASIAGVILQFLPASWTGEPLDISVSVNVLFQIRGRDEAFAALIARVSPVTSSFIVLLYHVPVESSFSIRSEIALGAGDRLLIGMRHFMSGQS